MSVLVVGGAGYIGSHFTRALLERGEDVAVVDNLATGHREAVPAQARLFVADIRDVRRTCALLDRESFDVALHFAAFSVVGESMRQPLEYFENNVGGMLGLLRLMKQKQIPSVIFSSSAAVYGEPASIPVTEDAPLLPTNPYGESKLIMEQMIRWVAAAERMRYVSLRYFNVAGAWPDGSIGEAHAPETHLVPLILQVPLGQRPAVTIHGTDYPTPDGSCVRDYISVADLTRAHLLAIDHLRAGGQSVTCNLGSEKGVSVLEMLQAAREATGQEIPCTVGERREGDPAWLVASAQRAGQVLHWQPEEDIEQMIGSAWRWHKSHPHGFAGHNAGKNHAPRCVKIK